jgi:predicted secreted protein
MIHNAELCRYRASIFQIFRDYGGSLSSLWGAILMVIPSCNLSIAPDKKTQRWGLGVKPQPPEPWHVSGHVSKTIITTTVVYLYYFYTMVNGEMPYYCFPVLLYNDLTCVLSCDHMAMRYSCAVADMIGMGDNIPPQSHVSSVQKPRSSLFLLAW